MRNAVSRHGRLASSELASRGPTSTAMVSTWSNQSVRRLLPDEQSSEALGDTRRTGSASHDALTATSNVYNLLARPMVPTWCTDRFETRVRVRGGRVHEVAPLVMSQRGYCLFGCAS